MRLFQVGVMLIGVVVYVFVVGYYLYSQDGVGDWAVRALPQVLLFSFLGWNALLLVVTVLVIVDSFRKVRAGKTRELATDVFVVKLAAIPFFLVNFAVMALLALSGMAILVLGGVALLLAVGISVGLTYLAMLSTSIYGWASLIQLRRERRIGSGQALLCTVLLFVFVADIVAGILLFVRSRRALPAPGSRAPVVSA